MAGNIDSHYWRNSFCDLGMTLNYIWWWGLSSGTLESVKHLFIVINLRSTQIWSGSTR